MRDELLSIPIRYGARVDIYSGVARLSGSIWGRLCQPSAGEASTAFLITHPTSNFLGHYALKPLAERGVAAVGLTTRYIGNDSSLLLENCVLDLAAAVQRLRDLGFERVVLVGNSGGGGLAALYQEQAENPTIRATPTGDPPDLCDADLPAVDGLILLMAHPGRAQIYTEWLDAAITDEARPDHRDASLDMFDPANGPPFSEAFVRRYREAQLERSERLRAFAWSQLDKADGPTDTAFVVHGTCADPRFLDLSLDPSDRDTGTLWGDAWQANHAPATLGRFTSAKSWISQWSMADTHCDGPRNLRNVSVPVMVAYGTADNAVFPSHAQSLYDAVPHDDKVLLPFEGATHYFKGQPELAERCCDELVAWADAHWA